MKVQCDNVNSHLSGHNMLDFEDSLSKRFYRSFFSASSISICIKGHEAQSKETSCPRYRASHRYRIKPSLDSSRSSPPTQFTDPTAAYCLLRRELPWSFFMSARRHPEFLSSAKLPCPRPHWPLSMDICDYRSPLFSLWDPIRRHVGLLPFWKERVIVLQSTYFMVMGLF